MTNALLALSRLIDGVTALIGPAYARYVLRLARIGLKGGDRLVEEYRRAVADEGRFIIAYRHPGDSDPHLVFHVLTNLLRGKAEATGNTPTPSATRSSRANRARSCPS